MRDGFFGFTGALTHTHSLWDRAAKRAAVCFAVRLPIIKQRCVRIVVCVCARAWLCTRVSAQLASPADYTTNFTYGAIVSVHVHAQASPLPLPFHTPPREPRVWHGSSSHWAAPLACCALVHYSAAARCHIAVHVLADERQHAASRSCGSVVAHTAPGYPNPFRDHVDPHRRVRLRIATLCGVRVAIHACALVCLCVCVCV